MFIPSEIIKVKRENGVLTPSQIQDFLIGFRDQKVSEAQMSALLMAIFIHGLNPEETEVLTQVMRSSGVEFDWSSLNLPAVDKHSTGGVGDKASMIILPLLLCEKVIVPMMAGRGLGHTGGTLDKLESMPGLNVFFEDQQIKEIIGEHGGLIMGQTEKVVPLDRRLYAMRDVTATVESIPLITASILSKKLASGVKHLVMDVKVGSGAFMKDLQQARLLADSLIRVGKIGGMQVQCLLTSMDQMLGRAAGNTLEMQECFEVLQGAGPLDTRDLSLELVSHLYCMGGVCQTIEEAREICLQHIQTGRAWDKFKGVMVAQGADPRVFHNSDLMPQAKYQTPILAIKKGIISKINVRQLGMSILQLGGGRKIQSDSIDYGVGLSKVRQLGEVLNVGDELLVVHHQTADLDGDFVKNLEGAFEVSQKLMPNHKLIIEKRGVR